MYENILREYNFTTKIFLTNILNDYVHIDDVVRVNYPWYEQSSERQRDRPSCCLPVISVAVGSMSIHWYLKPINGLPDPKVSLSATLPSAAIASANREVEKVVGSGRKRGPYKKYVSK